MKTTLEEKLRCVKLHLNEGVPIYEIQEKYGINHATLKYFCALYKKWGGKAFKVDVQRREYPREMKLKTIHEILSNGKSHDQIAIELVTNETIKTKQKLNNGSGSKPFVQIKGTSSNINMDQIGVEMKIEELIEEKKKVERIYN